MYPTSAPIEHALLLAVDWRSPARGADRAESGAKKPLWSIEDALEELARLAETAGIEVVGAVTQKMSRPEPGSYVGRGKLAEIRELKDDLGYDLVIADEELTPNQQRGLEEALGVKVLDRTALILDIFAQRAQTREGRLQVEVALLEYRLPRMTRMWTHLSRQTGGSGSGGGGGAAGTGGGVGLRGPGETQIEIDRRRARDRIAMLKSDLRKVHDQRELYRERRRGHEVPIVAIVGYTNAGKSTLLNALTDADKLAEDKLFATLDPTTRRVRLPSGREILVTDTVGFINNLPTTLVAAFRSTLEEINEADIVLHVLDITHANAAEQSQATWQVLDELGVSDRPTITALNKIDLFDDGVVPAELAQDLELPDDFVPISAETRVGFDALLARIEQILDRELVSVSVTVPYAQNALVDLFRREGRVEGVEYNEYGTAISGQLPPRLLARFRPYVTAKSQQPRALLELA
ncbi:MAG TPA: GTPase HflX [Thermomicrobiales bacterium]|jgi:GTP-binding protein HflX